MCMSPGEGKYEWDCTMCGTHLPHPPFALFSFSLSFPKCPTFFASTGESRTKGKVFLPISVDLLPQVEILKNSPIIGSLSSSLECDRGPWFTDPDYEDSIQPCFSHFQQLLTQCGPDGEDDEAALEDASGHRGRRLFQRLEGGTMRRNGSARGRIRLYEASSVVVRRDTRPLCKFARWQNLIPSFPWIAPGWRVVGWGAIQGKEGI